MPIQILLPALPPRTPPARLMRWRVSVGQQIAVGDIIADIDTGQATIEVESTVSGRIKRILVPENTWGMPPNVALALLDPDDSGVESSGEPTDEVWRPLDAPRRSATKPQNQQTRTPSPEPQRQAAPQREQRATQPPQDTHSRCSKHLASPRARSLAKTYAIDLDMVRGSGPGGRIVSRDVEAALKANQDTPSEKPAPKRRQVEHNKSPSANETAWEAEIRPSLASPAPSPPKVREIPSSPVTPHMATRATLLERAAQEIPCARLTIDCIVDGLPRLRRVHSGQSGDFATLPAATSPGVVFAKALGLALYDIPAANVTWTPKALLHHQTADVAFAVLIPELQVSPVIRNADTLTLDEIAETVIDLTQRAHTNNLEQAELEGAAAVILDLGAYGVRSFEPVVEPPRALSLSLGAKEHRPIVIDGQIRSASIINCTLTCDVRAIPIAVAAELLATIKALVEEPMSMLSPPIGTPLFSV
ncbi:putative Dihydrolipoyllysine-residue acetyltransferase component of pyruvate dehydrogenase complex [Candidatus Filomicrobium marinum]|uniref:Dihydrolipoamide acetyltransferase component of pyruvate dehydrogenase complex n=1 Tax=Candidatus Filomicrobium marinum TaxID=1608628 RepID=A0A0D6JI50_9HYPH|nr:dihydrolipoamide acetyltransferase family protein [Candidatus Filomicrobium marinum]CFX38040.1 putative Dihydrolipoyllysine-residue acetyltransferase component of pyruvate dehydrogenase complex [Candidatus Filomicrobium marinum]CPR21558.1 putative Dihydrolipoyllysine-residue acetyltransferase component of pyruvate dehydrogenase complex [Candidatus Filomicrobium marinum]